MEKTKSIRQRNTSVLPTNQTGNTIQAEHRRRVLVALDDFQNGRKEPPRRCIDCQLELFDRITNDQR